MMTAATAASPKWGHHQAGHGFLGNTKTEKRGASERDKSSKEVLHGEEYRRWPQIIANHPACRWTIAVIA